MFVQFKYLLERDFAISKRNPVSLRVRVFANIFVAGLLCIIYSNLTNDCDEIHDRFDVIFTSAFQNIIACLSQTLTFPESRNVLEKEVSDQLYFTTKI